MPVRFSKSKRGSGLSWDSLFLEKRAWPPVTGYPMVSIDRNLHYPSREQEQQQEGRRNVSEERSHVGILSKPALPKMKFRRLTFTCTEKPSLQLELLFVFRNKTNYTILSCRSVLTFKRPTGQHRFVELQRAELLPKAEFHESTPVDASLCFSSRSARPERKEIHGYSERRSTCR